MRRGLALVRVSKVGQRGDDLISPDLQRTAIQTYAKRHRITIVDWVEALDESGSQRRSPWWVTLAAAVARVETEQLDVIVVWKFSRLSRDRVKWAVTLDRIEKAGATLESATEGVDTTTATGRFTRGMLAELEAFKAEQIGEVWREVKQRRARLGLGDGQPRFGYDLTSDGYVPNEWAPVLASLYEQKAAGVSARFLTGWLKEQGAVTRRGNPYLQQGMIRMLDTGFGAGLLRVGGEYVPGIHKPVISDDVWRRYLAQRTEPTPVTSVRYPLSGLLICAYCGKNLHAASHITAPNGTLWVCSGGTKTGLCRGTSAWGPKVQRRLDEWMVEIVAGRDDQYEKLRKKRPAKKRAGRSEEQIATDLLVLARKNQQGFYDDQTYLALRQELLDERRRTQEPDVTGVSLLGTYGENRNEALRRVLRHVLVKTGRPKYRLIPRWPVTDYVEW